MFHALLPLPSPHRVARVHEYLAPPEGPYVGLYRSPIDIDVMFNATDGERRFASQYFIRRILEEDLAKDGNDTRSIYYLARTNSGVNNHTQAYYYYDLLAKRSKWDEEVYHGLVMKAIESKFLEHITWQERQQMFLDAYAHKPSSMDALHALAQDHFDSGRFHLAYLYIFRAVHIPQPTTLASVENVLLRPTKYLYEYEGWRLLGFAAREVGEWRQCVDAFQRVLKAQPQDNIVRERMRVCEMKAQEQEANKPALGAAVAGAVGAADAVPLAPGQEKAQAQYPIAVPQARGALAAPAADPAADAAAAKVKPQPMLDIPLAKSVASSRQQQSSSDDVSQEAAAADASSLSYTTSPTFILSVAAVFAVVFACALFALQRFLPQSSNKRRRYDD